MKLTIDFDNKIITVEDCIKFDALIEKLEKVVPDYKEYALMQKFTEYKSWFNSYPAQIPAAPLIPFDWNGLDVNSWKTTCNPLAMRTTTIQHLIISYEAGGTYLIHN